MRERALDKKRKDTAQTRKVTKMKKQANIHILPEIPRGVSCEEYYDRFMANWELAASIEYIPDSLKTLRAIDYTELKMLLNQNDKFFYTAMELCSDLVDDIIKAEKEVAKEMFENGETDADAYKTIQAVATLDDLLNCEHFFSDDYDWNRGEFIDILLECYLYR